MTLFIVSSKPHYQLSSVLNPAKGGRSFSAKMKAFFRLGQLLTL